MFLGSLLAVGVPALHAYVLEGWRWPSNQPIILDLQLGSPDHPLADGSTSWNQVAEAAMNVWNPYLGDGVQFEATEDASTPSQGDGKNSVFFSTSAYGEGFGDDALAVTLTRYDTGTGVASESDVIFNSAEPFDSYRGDLRNGGDGEPLYDLRRVAIHEFGHVLGLGHPPEGTQAIMDPVISDLDTVQADDLSGLTTVYGTPDNEPEIFEAASAAVAVVGKPFSFQIQAFGPGIGYQADVLPAGLSLDAGTGLISGTPTLPGTYVVNLAAANGVGSASATLTLTVVAPPTITGLLNVTATVNQPFTYQVRTSSPVTSYSVYNLPSGVSYNPTTGVISGTPTQTDTYSVLVEVSNVAGEDSQNLVIQVVYDSAVKIIASVKAGQGADSVSALLQAADGNLYGAGAIGKSSGGCVYKITLDGALTILHGFDSDDGSAPACPLVQDGNGNFYGRLSGLYYSGDTIFKMTPDGTVTTLYTFAPTFSTDLPPALVVGPDGNLYGGQTNFPSTSTDTDYGAIFQLTPDGAFTVLHELTADEHGVSALTVGTDGNFYGTFQSGEVNIYGAVFRMIPDGTVTVLHAFTAAEGSLPNGVIQGSDGNFYGTTQDFESSDGTNIAFEIAPDGTLNTLHVFSGEEPTSLTAGSDGNFYGTARSGEAGSAILFRLTPGGVFTKLHTFGADEGYSPTPVIQATDGNFYGLLGGGAQAEFFRTVAGPALTVTVAATPSKIVADSGEIGGFTLSLSAAAESDLIVGYTLTGSATNGIDYQTLKGTVKIRAGKTSKTIPVVPLVHPATGTSKKIKLTLLAGSGYTVGTATPVNMKIIAGK